MKKINESTAIEVYEWYIDIERRLGEVVRVVPFVEYTELETIRSPRLASVLLETASLVDTLFRNLMPGTFIRPDKKKVKANDANITDYFRVLEPGLNLRAQKSLLMKVVPTLLSPFSAWGDNEKHSLLWWESYNGVKHDRLKAARTVSLSDCVNALCALNQLMLKIDGIVDLVFRFGWADVGGYNPTVALKDLKKPKLSIGYVAYTDFFATFLHPVSFGHVDDIRPVIFRNKDRLEAHLGRLGTKSESE